MKTYDFMADGHILKLTNESGKVAYIDMDDFSVYKEEEFDSIYDLFGYYGHREEVEEEYREWKKKEEVIYKR